MQCAYNSVYLWKMAAEKAKSFDVDKVIAASSGLVLNAPEGKVLEFDHIARADVRIRVGKVSGSRSVRGRC